MSKYKIPNKGETVLVFDETGSYDEFDNFRKDVYASGGRLRRADCIESLIRHLAVYSPTFIVHLRKVDQ